MFSLIDVAETMPRYFQSAYISLTRSSIIMVNYCLVTFSLNPIIYTSIREYDAPLVARHTRDV